jgi:protein TonB
VLRFQRTLQAHVEHYRSYPATARRDRLQGTVQVLFAMRRDGTVLDAWVQASSGQMLLDKEALETIRRAQPLPAIPPELPGQLNILLPVSFDLP